MSAHKSVVERYFEGFRRAEHRQILACLAEDIVWDLPGFKHLVGRCDRGRSQQTEEWSRLQVRLL